MGSVTNVAAIADVKRPITQGLIQSSGVLVSTLIVCTFSALVVLPYGNFKEIMELDLKGANFSQIIVADRFGSDVTNYVIAGFLFIFTFTSVSAATSYLSPI